MLLGWVSPAQLLQPPLHPPARVKGQRDSCTWCARSAAGGALVSCVHDQGGAGLRERSVGTRTAQVRRGRRPGLSRVVLSCRALARAQTRRVLLRCSRQCSDCALAVRAKRGEATHAQRLIAPQSTPPHTHFPWEPLQRKRDVRERPRDLPPGVCAVPALCRTVRV